MIYTNDYVSPFGKILLASEGRCITGLWFESQKHFGLGLPLSSVKNDSDIFYSAKKWLDIYFSGKAPDFIPPIRFFGTNFQKTVWNSLLEIPYGKNVTYSEIAVKINRSPNCAQAVGKAAGLNPISLIVPCHRVIGKNGNLTGYAGGIELKEKLLNLEKSVKTQINTDHNTLTKSIF